MPFILLRECFHIFFTISTTLVLIFAFLIHIMAIETATKEELPCQYTNLHANHHVSNHWGVDRNGPAVWATIKTKWKVTQDRLQLAPLKWIGMKAVLHAVMIPRFILSGILEIVLREVIFPAATLVIPDTTITRKVVRELSKIKQIMIYASRDPMISRRRSARQTPTSTKERLRWFDYNRRSPSIPEDWMVLSAVRLRLEFIGMMRRMGGITVSDKLGLTLAELKADEKFADGYTKNCDKVGLLLCRVGNVAAIGCMLLLVTSCALVCRGTHHAVIRGSVPIRPMMMMTWGRKALALTHHPKEDDENCVSFATEVTRTEFGLDNCATHHICTEEKMFTKLFTPEREISVQGVAGSLEAKGVGTIRFTITDDDGRPHQIELNNVILLPSAPKNLISISRWSKDCNDDCAVMSRGEH